ncbi:MAG: hypothetical protein ACM3S4_11110 [Burkholderiales bacterium]
MYLFAAFFDRNASTTYRLKGKYLEHFKAAFPAYGEQLGRIKACLGYIAGNDNAGVSAVSLKLKSYDIGDDAIKLVFEAVRHSDIESGYLSAQVRALARMKGWLNGDGLAPVVVLAEQSDCEEVCESSRKLKTLDALIGKQDYKAALNVFAPLSGVNANSLYWNSPEILYRLGLACSKMAVTLKIRESEKKKLDIARQYREYCERFLIRGAEIEDGARCASALAYRYYSNVHELTRPGERRDENLEEQIEKANEWLSRAIEIYPQSVHNNYRKGKLIIEKQAPYLLFGKRSYGEGEARLLREIREVGEEHLASAIAVYESLEDEHAKEASRREYSKALFVLGGYYLEDAALPVHEYFISKIAGKQPAVSIKPISKMDIESARENLEKCFAAETDMPLSRLDTAALSGEVKKWTRSPVEKLYRIGCAYCAQAFILLAEGEGDKAASLAKKAVYFLNASRSVADKCADRKRNTWHISEKIAWAHILLGQYEKAAQLLSHARAGYIINTYAIALLLAGGEKNADKAKQALALAAGDRHNLAQGLTAVLLAYLNGEKRVTKKLSARNARLAKLLGIEAVKTV